jgi:hypothetical protein
MALTLLSADFKQTIIFDANALVKMRVSLMEMPK